METSDTTNTDALAATEDMIDQMKERLESSSESIMDMESLYGTYFIGEDEFAFHIKEMQEVVNYPAKINRLPLMPSYVAGVFNLRNTVVPLINLREILGMSVEDGEAANNYVGIICIGGQLVGVALDKTGDVLSLGEDDIAKVTKKTGTNVISGLANLSNGSRIIRVIDATSIVELEDMPILSQKIKDERDGSVQSNFAGGSSGIAKTAISFTSENTEFAIPVENILEVLEKPQLENTHVSFDNCMGILNLRGVLISVIDFRTAMGSKTTTDISTGMVIVVISNNKYCGFLVDIVTDVFDYHDGSIIRIPTLKDNIRKGCLQGVISVSEERDVFLLDSGALCDEDDICEAIDANSVPDALGGKESVGSGGIVNSENASFKNDLTVFITFRLGKTLAVEIQEVNEIIAYPSDLMEPPGYDGYIRGMLNLRGSIIPIVDMRKYYAMDDYKNIEESSVLVVTHEESLYGLIVDTVEDSVDVYASQTTTMPKVMNDSASKEFKGDVSRIIEYTDIENKTNTLMVYSIENLLKTLVGIKVA